MMKIDLDPSEVEQAVRDWFNRRWLGNSEFRVEVPYMSTNTSIEVEPPKEEGKE